VHDTAYVAPTATLVGDVVVGPRARVMYGAVLDAYERSAEVRVAEFGAHASDDLLTG